MQSIREKIKRKLSLHDKNPDLDDEHEPSDVDDETAGHLSREIEKAESEGYPLGKPGSFLNKLIMHGNKRTEDQLAKEHQTKVQLAKEQLAREQAASQQQN